MKRIKLMAEYGVELPLWGGCGEGLICAQDIVLSGELEKELITWSKEVDCWLNRDNPIESNATPLDRILHDCRGVKLLGRLQKELRQYYEVYFNSWFLGDVKNEEEFVARLVGAKYRDEK